MKVIYDREKDTLSIRFNDFPITDTMVSDNGTIFDFGDQGNLIAVEIPRASFQVGEPCTLEIGNQISHFVLTGA